MVARWLDWVKVPARATVWVGLALVEGCSVRAATHQGSGHLATNQRAVGEFHTLQVRGSAQVDVTVGTSASLELTWDDNLLPLVSTEVRDGVLFLEPEGGSFSSDHPLVAKLTTSKLGEFTLKGSGKARISGLQETSFRIDIDGSAQVVATGAAQAVTVSVSGSGDLDLRQVAAERASVDIKGSGKARVHASESLEGRISGSGEIRYSGSAKLVHASVAGSGQIVPD
jgi:hypothetical protein